MINDEKIFIAMYIGTGDSMRYYASPLDMIPLLQWKEQLILLLLLLFYRSLLLI